MIRKSLAHKSVFRLTGYLMFGVLLLSGRAFAAPQAFEELQVEVIGKGRPVLMIPGLNSGPDTWRETCAALQADHVQCHLVQLPGFAGLPAAKDASKDAWLADMRDRLLAYIDARGLKRPVVVGHSLGGELGLQMAIARPELLEGLVVVDSLPFFPAATNPAATTDAVRPMAEGMRQRMLKQDDAAYRAGALAAVKGMAHAAERVATLQRWGEASDRATTTQAMYELMTVDLRPQLSKIRTPTLVLGSWAGYAPYGATLESTRAIFAREYANLSGVRIEMSQDGYHFLMWDDPQWVLAQVRGFIASPAPGK
ncbi:alpha/beta hydrolase [Lysobacter sp. LF1]|uniref:Alpha/beta hydrolase n=1 Tax=Lysobacter stagni TaxID=3045172 RepID=A0ABT6XBR6_9GAMM|nr:alpha/beta hydrolase [Lysobacter sp. LF1]MDI9237380.1 alpha/beta hydrolase [Lysobacter sp. LF1]